MFDGTFWFLNSLQNLKKLWHFKEKKKVKIKTIYGRSSMQLSYINQFPCGISLIYKGTNTQNKNTKQAHNYYI